LNDPMSMSLFGRYIANSSLLDEADKNSLLSFCKAYQAAYWKSKIKLNKLFKEKDDNNS